MGRIYAQISNFYKVLIKCKKQGRISYLAKVNWRYFSKWKWMPNFCCRALCLILLSLPWRYSKLWPLCNPLNYFWMILDPFLQFVQLWIFAQIHRVTVPEFGKFHPIKKMDVSQWYLSKKKSHFCFSFELTCRQTLRLSLMKGRF